MSRSFRLSVPVTALLVFVLGSLAAGCRSQTPAVEPSATTTGAASPVQGVSGVQVFEDVQYDSDKEQDPASLDVYTPTETGSWPMVVMLHGEGDEDTQALDGWAPKVAQRGAVVLVPDWGQFSDYFTVWSPPKGTPEEWHAAIGKYFHRVTEVVRFARTDGARYGGDPEHLALFGHCTGANLAAVAAFGTPPAPQEGAEASGSTILESLVLFDGDFLLAEPSWDAPLEKDPSLMQRLAPWQYLGEPVDFPITVIGSNQADLNRDLGNSWDSWFAPRDPDGQLRGNLKKLGVLGGDIGLETSQQLLAERLSDAGDAVTYIQLTDSTHAVLGEKGMESLLDAPVPDGRQQAP